MLSPTVLDEHVVYPVNSYGSGMAPLFTNLAMWAGVFMLVALMKLEADDEGVEDLTATQAYLGRWLLLAVMAAAQGLIVTVGDLVIGVQTVSPVAFVATGVIASVTYSAGRVHAGHHAAACGQGPDHGDDSSCRFRGRAACIRSR